MVINIAFPFSSYFKEIGQHGVEFVVLNVKVRANASCLIKDHVLAMDTDAKDPPIKHTSWTARAIYAVS